MVLETLASDHVIQESYGATSASYANLVGGEQIKQCVSCSFCSSYKRRDNNTTVGRSSYDVLHLLLRTTREVLTMSRAFNVVIIFYMKKMLPVQELVEQAMCKWLLRWPV